MNTKRLSAAHVLCTAALVWTLSQAAASFAQAPAPAGNAPSPQQEEAALVAVVRSDASLAEKDAACRRLGLIGTKACVPALAALLADDKLCDVARGALEPIPDPAVDEALRAALSQVKGRQLVGVINSLGNRRDAGSAEALARLLGGEDPDAASAAASALGRIGGPAAVDALQKALAGSPASVRPAVGDACLSLADTLLRAGKPEEAAALLDRLAAADVPPHIAAAAVRGLVLARREKGLPLLVEQLRSDDKQRVRVALRLCRELPGAEVTTVLVAELGKLPPERQVLLIRALADRRDAAAAAAIAEAATRGDVAVRVAALGILPQVGDATVLPSLFDATVDANDDVAKAAQASLAGFPRNKEVDAGILTMMEKSDPRIRRAAIAFAGLRRIASATPALLRAADDADDQTRAAALRALGETVEAGDLAALTARLVKPRDAQEIGMVEAALSAACARLADKAACAGALLASLGQAQGPSRCAVLRLLRVVGGADALKAMRAAVQEPDAEVQDAAVRALADWPTPDAAPDLLHIAQSSANATHKVLSLRGYVRLIGVADVPLGQKLAMCRQAMDLAQRDDEKKLVLAGLAEVPDAEAAKMAEACLSNPAIRAEAELALLKIAQGMSGSSRDEATGILDRLLATSANAVLRQQAQDARGQIDRLGDFITGWQVTGPYSQKDTDYLALLAVPFAPEKAEAKDVTWRLLPAGTSPDRAFMLDLAGLLGGDANRAAYVRTWVHSDQEQPATMEFGTDDGSKLWLNGKVVHDDPTGGAATPSKYKVDATLKQGWNALLMKITQCSGPWEFCLRIRKADGSRLEGLKVQPIPPTE